MKPDSFFDRHFQKSVRRFGFVAAGIVVFGILANLALLAGGVWVVIFVLRSMGVIG